MRIGPKLIAFILLFGSLPAFALRQIECRSVDDEDNRRAVRMVLALPDSPSRLDCSAALGLAVSVGDTRHSDQFWAEWEDDVILIRLRFANHHLTLREPYSERPALSLQYPDLQFSSLKWPQFKCEAREIP